jgi:glycogen debranching enzyme
MIKIDNLVAKQESPSTNLYLTPGTHGQMIGAQDGTFPAFGHHQPNEMGGVWTHPIKCLDGFWLGLSVNNQPFTWLKEAYTFCNYGFYNEHIYELPPLKVIRRQFVPLETSGVVIEYFFENTGNQDIQIEGQLVARSDISPVWFSDTVGIVGGEDIGQIHGEMVVIQDSKNPWFVGLSLSQGESHHLTNGNLSNMEISKDINGFEKTYGQGVGVRWPFKLNISSDQVGSLCFRIAGSIISSNEVIKTIDKMADIPALFIKKQAHYQEILDTAIIDIPDKGLMEQYPWVKCHMEWLTTVAPSIGSGLTAGNPEYVWWFGCDSAYALAGCVPVGFHKLGEDTLDTIRRISKKHNGNGRIAHEINTFGVVCNPGNTQETAHFICAVYNTYRWTGNKEWLKSHYEDVKSSLSWLFEEMDTDLDLFPEGYGIMEVTGLNGELIDTAVYSAKALEYGSEMARIFREDKLANKYQALSECLKEKIIKEMWIEKEGLFADIRISGQLLYRKLDDFIGQVARREDDKFDHLIDHYQKMKEEIVQKNLVEDQEDRPWSFKNWVINTPLEMGLATREQAKTSLERLNSHEFVGEYGMYLSALEQLRIMTISTGVLVHANLQYGQADEALELIQRTMKTFGRYLPGSHSEMSPDYGCFVQAWTAYVMLSPVITRFIGVEPDAGSKQVTINPSLPADWDYAKVRELKIGTNKVDITVNRLPKDDYKILVSSREAGWKFGSSKAQIEVVI